MFKLIGIIVTVICVAYTSIDCLKVGLDTIDMNKNKVEQVVSQLTMSDREKRQYYAHMRQDALKINGQIDIYARILNELYRKGTYSEMKCLRLFNDFVVQKKNEFIVKYGEENASYVKYEQFLD